MSDRGSDRGSEEHRGICAIDHHSESSSCRGQEFDPPEEVARESDKWKPTRYPLHSSQTLPTAPTAQNSVQITTAIMTQIVRLLLAKALIKATGG